MTTTSQKIVKIITKAVIAYLISLTTLVGATILASDGNFDDDLQNSLGDIGNNLQQSIPNQGSLVNGEGIQSFIVYVAQDIFIPLIIIVGIIVAVAAFYQMFFSDDENAVGKGFRTLAWGAVGIIIMFSASFIVTTFVGTDGTTGLLSDGEFSGIKFVRTLYDNLVYPLLKIGLYLVVGVLFIILLTRVIGYVFASSEDAQKKGTTVIVRNSVGILIILAANQLVEAVFGRREDILNDPLTTEAGGTAALTEGSTSFIEIIFEIINRALGLIAIIILIIVMVQGYKLLAEPDSSDNIKSIGKSLGYAFLGLIVIAAGYLIVNFLLVQ